MMLLEISGHLSSLCSIYKDDSVGKGNFGLSMKDNYTIGFIKIRIILLLLSL
jgi:hypothetical protein